MDYRIKLERGFQKRLIDEAKKRRNLSWDNLGNLLNVSSSYLRIDLRYENILLSERLYKKLCKLSNLDYGKYILKKLNKDWGRSKGGKKSKPKEREVSILLNEHSEKLAELIGIMLGDGNLWSGKGFYYIRICGHSIDDKNYLFNHVRSLIKSLFDVNMGIYQHNKNKELYLTKGSKDLLFTLEHFGLKRGNKLKNQVGIPQWIFNSKKYLKACIRGLIDTDGTVLPITGRNYSYIWFTCGNPELRKDFEKAMKILGYKISKWNFHGTPETYIGSKNLIKKFYHEIGFNNVKHIKRFKMPL